MKNISNFLLYVIFGIVLWAGFAFIVYKKTYSSWEYKQTLILDDIKMIILGIIITLIILLLSKSYIVLFSSIISLVLFGSIINNMFNIIYDFYISPTATSILIGIAIYISHKKLLQRRYRK